MLNQKAKTFFLYTALIGFILTWWCFAFWSNNSPTSHILQSETSQYPEVLKQAHLSPISRDTLHKALAGDIDLMTSLIANWEIEAQILIAEGHPHIKHLPSDIFLRSQKIGRSAQIKEEKTSLKFLPQTYVSASFLLALLNPENIVAIPKGLRDQTHLFPESLTNPISHDVDRYSSETLYRLRPHIAFIAPYSSPATIAKLTNQNVQLVKLEYANTTEEIQNTLKHIGHVVQQPLKAELTAIFIEAALNAMDNRLALMNDTHKKTLKVTYLSYSNRYAIPTVHTLMGHILQRLQVQVSNTDGWETPIEKEQIVKMNPDCLIIASSIHQGFKHKLEAETAFYQQKIFVVDQSIQEFPSQYIVLAYFDIYQALLGARS